MIGDDIKIIVVQIRGDKVRLGVEAPRNLSVHRREVYDAIQRSFESKETASAVTDVASEAPATDGTFDFAIRDRWLRTKVKIIDGQYAGKRGVVRSVYSESGRIRIGVVIDGMPVPALVYVSQVVVLGEVAA